MNVKRQSWSLIAAVLVPLAMGLGDTGSGIYRGTSIGTPVPRPVEALLSIDLIKGWKDSSSASPKPIWEALPRGDEKETGVRMNFPAITKAWFNLYMPVREGSWPRGGFIAAFQARADKLATVNLRFNEMPGDAEGKNDRHDEFEAHVIPFDVATDWREFKLDLRDSRKLWGHEGANGKLDLEKITGVGFEPVNASNAVRLEVRGLRIMAGSPRVDPPTPVKSERYRIVFNSDRGGDYEIYAMDSDGRNLDRLTNHPGYDLWPAPSPDGKKIAWMTNRDGDYEIYVMNADGSEPVNITKHPKSAEGHPTWSPDGKTIAFTSDRDGDMELYLMHADGSNWRRLTNSKGSDGLPSFSPDGKHIVFVSERDGNHELYRINIDGTGLTRLTNHKALDTMPAWSPDGKTIAFVSDRDGKQAIFLMDADGTNVRRLAGPKTFAGWPDWSPDGNSLCYHALINDHFTICSVELSTGRVEELTRSRGANRNPRFARLAEELTAPPSIPDSGLRIAATVSGWLRSSPPSPNPQKYPFRYRGYGVLDKAQVAALLAKPGDVPAPIAKAIAQSLLRPGVSDSLESAKLRVTGTKLEGEATVLHKYGKQGTHVIVTKLEGSIDKGQLRLRAVKSTIGGTWNWGGGIAKQEGEVEIQFDVSLGVHVPHTR